MIIDVSDAIEHHRRGDLSELLAVAGRVLAQDPRRADVLHLLGPVALQHGDACAAGRTAGPGGWSPTRRG